MLHLPHFKCSIVQEIVATILESEMENSSSQKVPLGSPGLADCRTRNMVQVDSCLVLSSFHYSTWLPKHRSLMLMPLTESQQFRNVL